MLLLNTRETVAMLTPADLAISYMFIDNAVLNSIHTRTSKRGAGRIGCVLFDQYHLAVCLEVVGFEAVDVNTGCET